MYETRPFEITPIKARAHAKRVREVNKVSGVDLQGAIVEYEYTDSNGLPMEDGQHLTGYLIEGTDPRHRSLFTTAKITSKSTFPEFELVYTNGLSKRPYIILLDNEYIEDVVIVNEEEETK